MYTFESLSSDEVEGYGHIFLLPSVPEGVLRPKELEGETVMIDDNEYLVTGVQWAPQILEEDEPYVGSFGVACVFPDDDA